MKIPNLTPFKNVNTILNFYVNNAHDIFKNDLIGIYLWGSLSYDAFTIKKSDIDLVVILKNFQAINKYDIVNEYHGRISKIYEKWSTRLECLYTSADVLDISSIHKDKMLCCRAGLWRTYKRRRSVFACWIGRCFRDVSGRGEDCLRT